MNVLDFKDLFLISSRLNFLRVFFSKSLSLWQNSEQQLVNPPIFVDLEARSEITGSGSLFIVQLTSDRPSPFSRPQIRSETKTQIRNQNSDQKPELRSLFLEKTRAVGAVNNACVGTRLKGFHSKTPTEEHCKKNLNICRRKLSDFCQNCVWTNLPQKVDIQHQNCKEESSTPPLYWHQKFHNFKIFKLNPPWKLQPTWYWHQNWKFQTV